MGFFDIFKKTAKDWFQEAQRTLHGARRTLREAILRDAERLRDGVIRGAEEGEHAMISRELNKRITYCLERALKIDPSYAPALLAAGEREKNTDEAIRFFDRAIAANPTFGSAYYCKAKALERKGEFDEALICYEKTIELDPNDAEALMGKARLLSRKGKEKEASLYREKAKVLDPTWGKRIRLEVPRWLRLLT